MLQQILIDILYLTKEELERLIQAAKDRMEIVGKAETAKHTLKKLIANETEN